MRTLLLWMLAIAVASSAAANPIHLSFTLEPAETLPGVPVTFRIRAINTGTSPDNLPVRLRLEARDETDSNWNAICFLTWEHDGCATLAPLAFEGVWPAFVEIASGEELVLDYFAGPGSPAWLDHSDFLKLGTHRLRLVTWSDVGKVEPITSNEVVLTIRPPTGADAEAWQLISKTKNINMERARFAEQLWNLYPDSVYTAMTPRRVPRGDDWPGYIDAFTEALGKNPPVGFADSFKRAIADAHIHLMDAAIDELNVQRAFEHTEAARVLLEELLNKETEAGLKAAAAELRDQGVMPLVEIEEMVERRRRRTPYSNCERTQTGIVRSRLVALRDATFAEKSRKTLNDVIGDLDKYAVEAAKAPPDTHAALGALEQAVSKCETVAKQQLIPSADGVKVLRSLVAIAYLSARKAIQAAENDPEVKQSDLELARRKLADARASFDAGDFERAVSGCRVALHKAQGASTARGSFC